jgi:hypothetical protein
LSPIKVDSVLLDVVDATHVLGLRVTCEAWAGRFRPGASPTTARRAWDRFMARARVVGVRFTPEPCAIVLEREEVARLHQVLDARAVARAQARRQIARAA